MKRLYFPGANVFLDNLNKPSKDLSLQFGEVFDSLINLCEMSLLAFIVCTIRSYEDVIKNEPDEYKKKVNYIKKIIRENFKSPSLGTILNLARHCYHLIDEEDPNIHSDLKKMKRSLDETIILGPLSILLNDLYNITAIIKTNKKKRSKTIYRPESRSNLLRNLLPLFVEIRNTVKHSRDITLIIGDNIDELNLKITNWHKAFEFFVQLFEPMISKTYTRKTLGKIKMDRKDEQAFTFLVDKRSYNLGKIDCDQDEISFSEYDEIEAFHNANYSEMILSSQDKEFTVDLFPFMMIENDKLYFYKSTKAGGYEFFAISDNSVSLVETKKKFNYSAFKIASKGDQQSFFWSDVVPSTNQSGTIRGNIPTEGLVDFIGRRKQIRKIKEEIIEIPNQDGILFGPGGVGKTALMLQLSRELFDEIEDVYYSNIIWVTAKRDYYNPLLNFTEKRERKIESMDHICTAILSFFEYENIEEYGNQDKESLLLELLEDNNILLVVDNFESIPKIEQDKIIKFFGVVVKRRLRKKPQQFKLIVTSRERIPSGFHQIKLEGLDRRESKQLMKKLYQKYKGSVQDLSDEQKEKIHAASHGIPLIIIHCFGQFFEYNEPFESVCHGLCDASSEVIKFSFKELFRMLRKNICQLNIIILLELIRCPLMIRQISDILEADENEIKNGIPPLINYQCIERTSQGLDEKYTINDEIRLLTRSLVLENNEAANEVRKRIARNYTFDKQMDYTSEEQKIVEIFNKYLSDENYLEAEEFLKDQFKKSPQSLLLKFHYAKYLKEQKHEIHSAIDLLREIKKDHLKHPSILRLIISCYTSLDIPNYDKGKKYVNELKFFMHENDEIKIEIAEFYISWSTSIKLKGLALDPIKEIERKSTYKELAQKGINILKTVGPKNKEHKYHYLSALGFFNTWKNENALKSIDKAIELAGFDPKYTHSYKKLRNRIARSITKSSGMFVSAKY